MNCTIIVDMTEGNKITQHIYQFDDYRVAQAICNLMSNLQYVAVSYHQMDIDPANGDFD